MKKKSSHLGNLKNILMRDDKTPQQLSVANKYSIELPKIHTSVSRHGNAKKTLMGAIKKIEEYIEAVQKPVPPFLSKCLGALRCELHLYPSHQAGKVRNTESNELSHNKQNQPIYKSQVFNVNKSRLQKVASKDLFEKVSTVKYSVGDMLNVSDKDVIGVLKEKIKEKDLTIAKLHSHIDQLQTEIIAQRNQKTASKIEKEDLLLDRVAILQDLSREQEKGFCMSQQIADFESKIASLLKTNNQAEEKRQVLANELADRQSQLLSLWQLTLKVQV